MPLIKALLAAGAAVQAYDPEATKVAKGIFGTQRHVRGQELRRAEGRRLPGDRDRVERVPAARLREDARS